MKSQKLYSYVRKAVDDFGMIEDGDKIAIGISGGKDSLTLLYALSGLKIFYPNKFQLVAITVDLGFGIQDLDKIKDYCKKFDVEYHVIETQISDVVFEQRKESNPCSLCAKMRKGALNNKAEELGCNKIAYAGFSYPEPLAQKAWDFTTWFIRYLVSVFLYAPVPFRLPYPNTSHPMSARGKKYSGPVLQSPCCYPS